MLLVHISLYNLEYIYFSKTLEKNVKRDWPIIWGEKFVSFSESMELKGKAPDN